MSTIRSKPVAFLLAALLLASAGILAVPGSGESPPPMPLHPALEGYCPVCLLSMGKIVKGKPAFHSTYDGKTFLFPGAEQKAAFDADPEKFLPAFGGKCVVCQKLSGHAGPGKAEFFSRYQGRLFLFPGPEQKRMFDRAPERYADVGIALDGYCPVCLHGGKRVKGDPKIRATYDGLTYLFPSERIRSMFTAAPEKFVPALGGDCVVCKKEMGKAVPGTPEHAVVHEGRLFLFPSGKQETMFQANPDRYADVDLGLEGYCPVCLTLGKKLVKGRPEFAAYFEGMRYLFPRAELREKFRANPAAFVNAGTPAEFRRLKEAAAAEGLFPAAADPGCGCGR